MYEYNRDDGEAAVTDAQHSGANERNVAPRLGEQLMFRIVWSRPRDGLRFGLSHTSGVWVHRIFAMFSLHPPMQVGERLD